MLCGAGAALLLLASCSGDKKDGEMRTLADYDNVTTADSLLYYFGQLRSVDYWQYAHSDTVLETRASRDEYLKGLRAGMDAARDNEAYNQGLYVGVQLAMNMKEFAEDYNVKFNRAIVMNAIEDGLKNDSAVNAGEANRNFRMVLDELNRQKEENDRATAASTLSEAARAGKWSKISDNLYGGLVKTQGTGAQVKEGDFIGFEMQVATTDGADVDRRKQDRVKVGRMLPEPVVEALKTMKVGETRTFYTTGPAMFGRMMSRYNLKPAQLLTLTLTVTPATAPKAEEAE